MNPTYEKASETELKVITPVEQVISLSTLKKELEETLQGRERIVKDNTERLAKIDEHIAKIQLQISEAGKLNIKEEGK